MASLDILQFKLPEAQNILCLKNKAYSFEEFIRFFKPYTGTEIQRSDLSVGCDHIFI